MIYKRFLKCAPRAAYAAYIVFCVGVFPFFCAHAQEQEIEPPQNIPEREVSSSFMDMASKLLNFNRVEGIPTPIKKPALPKIKLEDQELFERYQAQEQRIASAPLSASDQALYSEIFKLQKAGEMKQADTKIKDLENLRLLGHVLYQRYMHPNAYTSSASELKTWLAHFADHPNANKIYKLASRKGASNLEKPQKRRGIARVDEPSLRIARAYSSNRKRTSEEIKKLDALKRKVVSRVRRGEFDSVTALLNANDTKSFLDTVERDILKSEIATGYMYWGRGDKAYEVSTKAVSQSGISVPKGAWVAGLLSWQKKQYTKAAQYFETAARSPYASPWMTSAASYWAARAHMRIGNVKDISGWLKRGAQHPRTFYGLISTRALGRDFDFNWDLPTFTKEMHAILFAKPSGARALDLAQVGEYDRAQAELLGIRPKNETERAALLAYAGYANLPGLAMRIASASKPDEEGRLDDAALYPLVPWMSHNEFRIDPALAHAIMRQESRFDTRAESPSGAVGLMQLIPSTAKSVADTKDPDLEDPQTNLELGQRYIEKLLGTQRVNNDILALLIAYNAGPGNLGKWRARWPDVEDPLLFIELIPSGETRAYVERVLSNYWIYRMRAGQETPTLDAVAEGRPAKI